MDYQAFIQNKIIRKKEDLNCTLNQWRFQQKKIVFTNGCFDILHRGHVEYLAKAAELGDKLIIGLNTDNSVRRLKGENRPVNNEDARAILLSSLIFTDRIIFFEENTPLELIRYIQPDVLVKGNDYKPEEIVGYDIVKSKGGEIITIELTAGFSTTSILKRI
ncbi:MAG: D-glycero-beta-D-manno-heptose 1-phosphate adenylyltransferase [Odoribacter sp.]|nr:D-glycero-beta-D-manno-heptose 1-phosphate adenylyltransferase [Odoribacter sp.]